MDIITVILITLFAGFIFNYEARRQIRLRRARRMFENIRERQNSESVIDGESEEVSHTIDLIGEEEFREMTARIDGILLRHGTQPCLNLRLSCGPDSLDGSAELHNMLPGYEVQLILCGEGGVSWVDAYHNGSRIGRLALLESQAVRDLLATSRIRGAYVAEQNCFGIEGSYDMRIIVFYEPKKEDAKIRNTDAVMAKRASQDLEICEN